MSFITKKYTSNLINTRGHVTKLFDIIYIDVNLLYPSK